jgi:hypothetical protein
MGGNSQFDLQLDADKKTMRETLSDTGSIRSVWISFTY